LSPLRNSSRTITQFTLVWSLEIGRLTFLGALLAALGEDRADFTISRLKWLL
jgi:hypothetical protein